MRASDSGTVLRRIALFAALALIFAPQSSRAAGDVDSARLRAADSEPQNWFGPESDLLLPLGPFAVLRKIGSA
jgi:hypothetical protein